MRSSWITQLSSKSDDFIKDRRREARRHRESSLDMEAGNLNKQICDFKIAESVLLGISCLVGRKKNQQNKTKKQSPHGMLPLRKAFLQCFQKLFSETDTSTLGAMKKKICT